jgi:predicted O-methyltransferase YrrM
MPERHQTARFEILQASRVEQILERLHREADRQTPGLVFHYLPKLPALLLGRKIDFTVEQVETYYADKYLALERDQAAFCYLTARALGARRIVEFGTSFGISTIWLASALRDNGGGVVIGTELVPEKAERAVANLRDAGLEEFVEVRVGDATQTLRDLDGPIDLLLNDGFPMHALEVLKLVAPKLRPGGVVITDNVGTMRGNYREYLEWVRDPRNGFRSMLIPFKSGTEYSVRVG